MSHDPHPQTYRTVKEKIMNENGNNSNHRKFKTPMPENDIHTPEDLAREVIEFPNLWGMYAITDVIHRLIKEAKEK